MIENDLIEGSPPLSPDYVDQIPKLANFQISRSEAEVWAIKDCKFLIFDDSDDKNKTKCAGDSHRNLGNDSKCIICTSCPEFPHDRKTQNFRIFRPRDLFPHLEKLSSTKPMDICMHYVAVSYCWPEPSKDQSKATPPQGSYQVRDLDDSLRPNRAPDAVLDQAVDVANSVGLRMIWIDQECLPQPADGSPQQMKDEQQLGLQAMDIIYNRAIITAGIHDFEISNQRQADVINTLTEDDAEASNSIIRLEDLDLAIDFLDSVSRDRWYTRAWIAQEALSAGMNLLLIFRRAAGIAYASHFRFNHPIQPPGHSLDTIPRQLPSDVVCILISDFRQMVANTKKYLDKWRSVPQGKTLLRRWIKIRDINKVILAAESLHPTPAATKSSIFNVNIYALNNYRSKYCVDAAGALTLLKTRQCRDHQDLVAIIANMCGYDVRLNTSAIAAHCKSLRAAILALALLNGDLSLLVPELYSSRFSTSKPTIRNGPLWYQPFDIDASSIDHVDIRNFIPNRAAQQHISANRIGLVSYLWNVEDEIDLSPVREQWSRAWNDLKSLKITVARKDGEAKKAFDSRKLAVNRHFGQPEMENQVKNELFETGCISASSAVWDGIESAGIQITSHLDSVHVEATQSAQIVLSQMIFSILKFLLEQSETDSRALGLANSIWQSLRVDTVSTNEENLWINLEDLPDEVCKELFRHRDVVHSRFRTLKLDKTPSGEYRQAWLFERIMSTGSLWVGRYRRGHEIKGLLRDIIQERKMSHEPNVDQTQLAWLTRSTRSGSTRSPILQRQLGRQLEASLHKGLSFQTLEESNNKPNAVALARLNAGLGEILREGVWTPEAEDERAQDLVAAFDVDGPCLIATPFNSDWEVLPHPPMRSMSVCWMIEKKNPNMPKTIAVRLKQENSAAASSQGNSSAPEDSDGSWLKESQDSMCQTLFKDQGATIGIDQLELLEQFEVAGSSYYVTNKVRGMWTLMDVPYQVYYFY